jgi:hypothetical protein
MKELIINNYLATINFADDKWSVKKIKEDLKKMVGEEPAININYIREKMIVEGTSTPKIVEKIEYIEVIFHDDADKIKSNKFTI